MPIDIVIAISLSIFTTAILFAISHIFKKKWNINHPKNTFLIYLVVLSTAISIFPYASIAFSTSSTQLDSINMIEYDSHQNPGSASTILTENENITYASSISPLSTSNSIDQQGITQYLQKISWNELIILDENQKIEDKTTPKVSENKPIDVTNILQKKLITLHKNGMKTSDIINYIVTNLIINQQPSSEKETNINPVIKENQDIHIIPNLSVEMIFYSIMLVLFILSVSYIGSSIFLTKKRILHRLQAKKCTNKSIIKLIATISKEFNIKPPIIYQYNGPPNAFVFGLPTTLAFSVQLKKCLSKNEFEAAMRHELAHIKNHDILIKPVLQGIRLFFFYNPFVHKLVLSMMKTREKIADSTTFSKKSDKVSLIEALIKIQEYTNNTYKESFPAYQIPLLSYKPSKLTLTDRFTNLFEKATKKTLITLLVSCFILFANISIFFVAEIIVESPENNEDNSIQKQEFTIDKSYYSESIIYTEIQKNAKMYRAKIVQKNIYNIISAKPSSSELIKDMIQNFIHQDDILFLDLNKDIHF